MTELQKNVGDDLVNEVKPPIADESGIGAAYEGADKAAEYIGNRFTNELMGMLHERQVAAVNAVMRETKPQRTLEVAPGPGRLTRDVVPAGQLTCLEYNEGMIAEGQQACGDHVQWVQGNAFELPFEAGEFDFVYSFRFVRHFHKEDRERLHAELYRVLKPGGRLVLDAVNAEVSAPLRASAPESYPIYDKLYRDESELRDELLEAGFETVKAETVQRWFSLQCKAQNLIGPRSRFLCRAIIQLLERFRSGPSLEWIITAKKIQSPAE